MAIIVATFDTKEKTLAVTMDDKKMKDVESVGFYAGWDDKDSFSGSVSRIVRRDEEGYNEVTYISASRDAEEEITTERVSFTDGARIARLSKALFPHKE